MIRPAVADTVEAVRRALDGAGTSPADLAALVLVGGSVRIPLVPQLLSEEFGRDVTVAPDPVGVVAVGAALVAAGVRRPGPSADARAGARPPVTGGRTPAPPAAAAPAPSARAVERPVAASPGPGTLPLAAAAGSPDGTEVLAVARPPKQARPFVATQATTSRPRRIAVLASAGAVALAVLGGVVAFGIERVGAGTEAGAVTPAAVDTSAPAPTVVVPRGDDGAEAAPAAAAAHASGHAGRTDDERAAARHDGAPGHDEGRAHRPPRPPRRRPRRRRTAAVPGTVTTTRAQVTGVAARRRATGPGRGQRRRCRGR